MELTIYLHKDYQHLLEEQPDNIIIKELNEFFM